MPLRLRLELALALVHVAASATLLRSILYDRWITVLASLVLLGGAAAARRGKTWGIGVALGAGAAFPMARMLGMAPAWFWAVGAIGALPFLLTSRSLARFDAKATAVGASLATTVGLLSALGWRVFAPAIVTAFPALRPGFTPANGEVAVFAMAALVLLGWALRRATTGELEAGGTTEAFAHASPRPALRVATPGARVHDGLGATGALGLAPPEAAEEPDEEALAPPAGLRRRANPSRS